MGGKVLRNHKSLPHVSGWTSSSHIKLTKAPNKRSFYSFFFPFPPCGCEVQLFTADEGGGERLLSSHYHRPLGGGGRKRKTGLLSSDIQRKRGMECLCRGGREGGERGEGEEEEKSQEWYPPPFSLLLSLSHTHTQAEKGTLKVFQMWGSGSGKKETPEIFLAILHNYPRRERKKKSGGMRRKVKPATAVLFSSPRHHPWK